MFALKPISHEGVSSALSKAERYRLLNEPGEAESICRDILEIEPDNQQALVHLVLALTDQVDSAPGIFAAAIATAQRLHSEYDRAYYEGIAWERRAKARFHGRCHGGHDTVHEWVVEALHKFEEAERLRPHGNDDAILRWNTCVRFLAAHRELAPREAEEFSPIANE
jgi:hypothetical protein